ncbi:MAG: addiction module protein [Desulfobacterales bacterium]|nr:addiction module protein [Desulfobacterales bacterium]
MQYTVNKSKITDEIRKLGVIERLNIITDIWDEIKESEALEPVSEEEKKLLLNRLANYRANPDSASDWTELKREVYDRYDKQS